MVTKYVKDMAKNNSDKFEYHYSYIDTKSNNMETDVKYLKSNNYIVLESKDSRNIGFVATRLTSERKCHLEEMILIDKAQELISEIDAKK